MESLAQLQFHHQHLHLSLNRHRPSFSKPISSLSFRTPILYPQSSDSSSSFKSSSIGASSPSPSSTSSSDPLPQTHKPSHPQSLNPLSSPILKTACLAIATAALFFTGRQLKPAIAATIYPLKVPIVDSYVEQRITQGLSYGHFLMLIEFFEALEKALEDRLRDNPDDIEALSLLVDVLFVIQGQMLDKRVIRVITRLIQLEPENVNWVLLMGNAFRRMRKFQLAVEWFEAALEKDPFCYGAYEGILGVAAEPDGYGSVKNVMKRIEKVLKECKKEERSEDVRKFKLLIAQGRAADKDFKGAFDMCSKLVKEDPSDLEPEVLWCILLSILEKKDK